MKTSAKPRPKTGWQRILELLPDGWQEQAFEKNAMSYNRKYDPESLLRSVLLYLSSKTSLQETTLMASLLDLPEASAPALHNRFRKSGNWLLWLAEQIMQKKLAHIKDTNSFHGHCLRIIDATRISQPGTKVGQPTWRLHFSMLYPSNCCSEFHLTTSTTGESFKHFDIKEKDLVMGDRIYSRAAGIAHVVDHDGDVLVRIMPSQFPVVDWDGSPIDILARLKSLRRGKIRKFDAQLKFGKRLISGRIIALKLSSDAARRAKKRALKSSQKARRKIRPETLQAAEYLILFTTLPDSELKGKEAIALYRYRWQVEGHFKRAKSIFGLGALPCFEEDAVRAWIYGKLLLHFIATLNIPETGDFPPSDPKSAGRNKSFHLAGGKILAPPHGRQRQTGQSSS